MPNNNANLQPSLTFTGVEKVVNKCIAFVFYYRLVVVLLCLLALAYLGHLVWAQSQAPDDRLKNIAVVFTCGSIIIAIFYSVLNYEYTHIRFKHDKKNTIDTLTFNIAAHGYDEKMIGHFKNLKIFYDTNKELATTNPHAFSKALDEQTDTRISFVVVFNYFEHLAVGLEQGLIDEQFTMAFFKTLIKTYHTMFSTYIDYLRQKHQSDRIFKSYIALATRWKSLD